MILIIIAVIGAIPLTVGAVASVMAARRTGKANGNGPTNDALHLIIERQDRMELAQAAGRQELINGQAAVMSQLKDVQDNQKIDRLRHLNLYREFHEHLESPHPVLRG